MSQFVEEKIGYFTKQFGLSDSKVLEDSLLYIIDCRQDNDYFNDDEKNALLEYFLDENEILAKYISAFPFKKLYNYLQKVIDLQKLGVMRVALNELSNNYNEVIIRPNTNEDVLSIEIKNLTISTRLKGTLKDLHIDTLSDLIVYSEEKFLNLHGVGVSYLSELKLLLSTYGLSFAIPKK